MDHNVKDENGDIGQLKEDESDPQEKKSGNAVQGSNGLKRALSDQGNP